MSGIEKPKFGSLVKS